VNTAVVGYLRQKLGMDVDVKECFEKAKNWISKSLKKTGSYKQQYNLNQTYEVGSRAV
jgi:hypothetical protein